MSAFKIWHSLNLYKIWSIQTDRPTYRTTEAPPELKKGGEARRCHDYRGEEVVQNALQKYYVINLQPLIRLKLKDKKPIQIFIHFKIDLNSSGPFEKANKAIQNNSHYEKSLLYQ